MLDTRNTGGPVGAGGVVTVDLAARVPAATTAVVLNVTGVTPTAPTFVTVFPSGGARPVASSLNLTPGDSRPNQVTVTLSAGRKVDLYNNSGNVHLVADMAGAFAVVDAPTCTTDCVYGWGRNGDDRALGTLEAVPWTSVPTRASLTGVRAITGSMWGTQYALRADGMVVAWGRNDTGQLGNGGSDNTSVAAPIPGLTDVVAIGSSWGTGYAVRADGTVWAWGVNSYGELGNGSIGGPSLVPVQASGLTGVTAVSGDSGGDGVYALRGDGTVWAWGSSYRGVLGNGVECEDFSHACVSVVPVQMSNLSDVTQIASFSYGAFALRADGTVAGWGQDIYETLANDQTYTHSAVPVPVQGLSGATAIAADYYTGWALVPSP